MIGQHPHERALVELCKATTAASYTKTVFHWLQERYPESATRLQGELRAIYKKKRAANAAQGLVP